ncbi:MAG TPA: AraC family transcriptional regulator [Ohtaekwangia sp.]|uniref:helix-turn-helix domain-containing protein n=1 Tax=Ohtaekwangia sp. TaxID=2066019 RepID=UPI002F928C4B
MEELQTWNHDGIIYSVNHGIKRSGEEFIKDHSAGYIIAGKLLIIDGDRTDTYGPGDIALFRKNNLAKFIKQSIEPEPFKAVSIILDNGLLTSMSESRKLYAGKSTNVYRVSVPIAADSLLQHYFNSLLPLFKEPLSAELIRLKKEEAVLTLLHKNPFLQDILFDFGIPGKINLEAFMNRNFRYNVPLEKMAFLTGRSLATFKRDFEKTFGTSPNRWIQQMRLKEAHYLITEKNIKPSEVYLQVGFETLSHFSYSFKQFFGKNPSAL